MRSFATKKDMKYGKIAPFEKSVSQFIPYTRLVDENTIKTNEGYLIQVIKLEGIPFETALTSELNHKKEIRASMLKGISNSRFALYHHIIRRKSFDNDEGVFADRWCQKLNETYQARLSRKKMFVNEQYLTIVRRPAQSKIGSFSQTFKNFSGKFDANIRKSMEDNAHKALNDATRNIIKAMEPYKPTLLGFYNM